MVSYRKARRGRRTQRRGRGQRRGRTQRRGRGQRGGFIPFSPIPGHMNGPEA
jgi:hypothetical protein